MSGSAGLSFDVDSSQARAAVQTLAMLKDSAAQAQMATAQLAQANAGASTSFANERDAVARANDAMTAYDNTVGGLVRRMSDLRTGLTSTTGAVRAFGDALRDANAAAISMNGGVDALDRYVRKATELKMATNDLAAGFDKITGALQNQTIEGNRTRLMLEQLGISLKGVPTERPDMVLQQLGSQLRQYRDNAYKLSVAQQFVPGIDAAGVRSLEQSPYQTMTRQRASEREAATQSRISQQQLELRRRTEEIDRQADELADLRTRFSRSTNPIARTPMYGQLLQPSVSRDQELIELRRIRDLPEDQRSQYAQLDQRMADFRDDNRVTRFARNITSGQASSNLDEVALRQRMDENAMTGPFRRARAFVTGQIRGLGVISNQYTPLDLQDNRQISEGEREFLRGQAGGILAERGDPSLARITATRDQVTRFNTEDVRRRYGQGFGEEEGARRFALQLQNMGREQRYAEAPVEASADEIARRRFVMDVTPYQRARASQALQFSQSQGAGFMPGQTLAGTLEDPRLNARQREVGRQQFQSGLDESNQQRTEEIERQEKLQEGLAGALEHGRAAAENYTRAWQAYTQALLAGNSEQEASRQGMEALSLTMAQRMTQGRALVSQMALETDATQRRLDQTRNAVNADPLTRRTLEVTLGIKADRERLIEGGQLPNPAGGSFKDPRTGEVKTVDAPGAREVIDQYTERRRLAAQQAGEDTRRGISSGASDEVRDSERMLQIQTEMGVTRQRALQILTTEKALRDSIAASSEKTRDADAADANEIAKRTAEQQRQTNMTNNRSQNLDAAATQRIDNMLESAINRLPLPEQPAARAALPAMRQAAIARELAAQNGTTGVVGGGAPLAAGRIQPLVNTSLPPAAQILMPQISASEAGSYNTRNTMGGRYPATFDTNGPHPATGDKRDQASGRFQDLHATWISSARGAGVDPNHMTPSNQDAANWWLAKKDYARNTIRITGASRDLERDLMEGGHEELIAEALKTTWTSLPGTKETNAVGRTFVPRLKAALAAAKGAGGAAAGSVGNGQAAGGTPIGTDDTAGNTAGTGAANRGVPVVQTPAGAAGGGVMTQADADRMAHDIARGRAPSMPGGGPADNAALGETVEESRRAVRIGREGQNTEQQTRFAEQQRIARERERLLSIGDRAGAERLVPTNVGTDADLARQEAGRQRQAIVQQQREGQTVAGRETTQSTEDTRREIAATNESSAALGKLNAELRAEAEIRARGGDIVDKNTRSAALYTEQLEKERLALAQSNRANRDNAEVQRASNAAGPFASGADIQAVRARVELEQRFRASPGLRESEEGQQAMRELEQNKVLAQQTEQMNDLRQASQSMGQAATEGLKAIALHGAKGRDVVRELGKTFKDIAFDTLVGKPLQRGFQAVLGQLFGTDSITGDGAKPAGAAQSPTDGVLNSFGPIGSLLSSGMNALSGSGGAGNSGNGLVGSALGSIGSGISSAAGWVGDQAQSLWNWGKGLFGGDGSAVDGATNGVAANDNGVGGVVSSLISGAGKSVSAVGETGGTGTPAQQFARSVGLFAKAVETMTGSSVQGGGSASGSAGGLPGLIGKTVSSVVGSAVNAATGSGAGGGGGGNGQGGPAGTLGGGVLGDLISAGVGGATRGDGTASGGGGSVAGAAGSGGPLSTLLGGASKSAGGLMGALVNAIGGKGFYENGGLIGANWNGSMAQGAYHALGFGDQSGGVNGPMYNGPGNGWGGPTGTLGSGTLGDQLPTGTTTSGSNYGYGQNLSPGTGDGASVAGFDSGAGASQLAGSAFDSAETGAAGAAASDAVGSAGADAMIAAAKGRVFPGGGRGGGLDTLDAYENTIVDRATVFRFARGGQFGQMGEAGPEAIIPLKRGADGRLGVSHDGAPQRAQPTVVNQYITTPDANSFRESSNQTATKAGQAIGRASQRNQF